MSKTFTIVGVSTQHNTVKHRVANGSLKIRQDILRRAGHTDIKLYELPNPMEKEAAIAWLNEKFGADVAVTPKKSASKAA